MDEHCSSNENKRRKIVLKQSSNGAIEISSWLCRCALYVRVTGHTAVTGSSGHSKLDYSLALTEGLT
jgi:hypothetical protein